MGLPLREIIVVEVERCVCVSGSMMSVTLVMAAGRTSMDLLAERRGRLRWLGSSMRVVDGR